VKLSSISSGAGKVLLALAVFGPGIVSLLGFGFIINLVSLAACVPIAFSFLDWTTRRHRVSAWTTMPGFYWAMALIALQYVALCRGVMSGASEITDVTYRLLLSAIFSALAVWVLAIFRKGKSSPLRQVLYMLASLCAANSVLWMIGVRNGAEAGNIAASQPASILGALGIEMKRAYLPLTWGINAFGTVAAAIVCAGLVLFIRGGRNDRGKALLILAPSLACILLADSRAAIGNAVAAAIIACYVKWSARTMVVLVMVGMTVLFMNLGLLDQLDLAGIHRLDASALSGRELIWAPAIAEILNPSNAHIFGFGHYGHFVSKVSLGYASVLAGWGDTPETIHVHNTYLQGFLDTGYMGIAVLIGFVITAMKAFSHEAETSVDARICLALLIFLSVLGFSEITFQAYVPWNFILVLAIAAQLWQPRMSPMRTEPARPNS
jgi:hypothetical protein